MFFSAFRVIIYLLFRRTGAIVSVPILWFPTSHHVENEKSIASWLRQTGYRSCDRATVKMVASSKWIAFEKWKTPCSVMNTKGRRWKRHYLPMNDLLSSPWLYKRTMSHMNEESSAWRGLSCKGGPMMVAGLYWQWSRILLGFEDRRTVKRKTKHQSLHPTRKTCLSQGLRRKLLAFDRWLHPRLRFSFCGKIVT